VIDQILAVGAVIGLGLVWWLRRRGLGQFRPGRLRARRGRRLELRERLPLSPQHSLCLVRIGGRALLVGLSSAGCSLLDSWQDQEPEERA
jgi:flagellar biogenesis protein FliO